MASARSESSPLGFPFYPLSVVFCPFYVVAPSPSLQPAFRQRSHERATGRARGGRPIANPINREQRSDRSAAREALVDLGAMRAKPVRPPLHFTLAVSGAVPRRL